MATYIDSIRGKRMLIYEHFTMVIKTVNWSKTDVIEKVM